MHCKRSGRLDEQWPDTRNKWMLLFKPQAAPPRCLFASGDPRLFSNVRTRISVRHVTDWWRSGTLCKRDAIGQDRVPVQRLRRLGSSAQEQVTETDSWEIKLLVRCERCGGGGVRDGQSFVAGLVNYSTRCQLQYVTNWRSEAHSPSKPGC